MRLTSAAGLASSGRESSRSASGKKTIGEQNTKAALIDPLWGALGWDLQEAIEALLAEEDGGLIRVISKKAAGGLTRSEVRTSPKRAKIRIDFPLPSAPAKPIAAPQVLEHGRKRESGPARHEAGKKAWETMAAQADATLTNLIEAGFIESTAGVGTRLPGSSCVTAVIQPNGTVIVDGESYDSLSTAGGMARKSVIGTPADRPYPQTNGWRFWRYRDKESGELREMDHLRKQYLATKR